MILSNNAMHVLCLRLGLNCGSDSIDYQGITVLSITPLVGSSKYTIKGFHSLQDHRYTDRLINKPFEVLL